MADAVLSVVLERVAAITEEKIRSEVSLVRGVKKEVVKLSDKLKTVRNVLDDAERRGVKDVSVRGWLKKLEDTAYEMEDILDEWNYYAIDASAKKKVCCSFMPSSCLCFKKVSVWRPTAKKIQNVKASLDEILKEKDQFNFVTTMPTTDSTPRFETTSSIDLEKVEGQDVEKNKDDIVGKLMMNSDSQQVLSIVGMGGIGKTTLAQLVYNNSRVKGCFDLTIWVCVSDPFDVADVARRIIENMGSESPPNTNQLEVILRTMKNCISGKKFLLVLDDVWTEDYNKWEPLKINLKYGAPSSKILVTTRNERVAMMMGAIEDEIYRPQLLKDDECWSLLRRISFHGKKEHGEFEEVGKEIATRCKGRPLAANILGSLLQFKNSLEEWENVLKSEIWQMGNTEKLFPHLLLSYNELSPPLKRCFSYCAVFPKDSEIEVESLIQQWMALGYLGSVNESSEEVGRDYFNNLAMRSLFQDFERDDSTKQISSCKMHDIVHDFCQLLRKTDRVESVARVIKRTCQLCNPCLVSHVQEFHSLLWDIESPPNLCDCLASLRVFRFNRTYNSLDSPHGIEKLIHLRWLSVSWTILSKGDMKSICKLYFLQTLLLEGCSLEEIPNEIEKLVHLRHLNLNWNIDLKMLPESICSLLELQTLLLEGCPLEEIPSKIENMVGLKILAIKECGNLRRLPEGLANLSGIRALDIFHGGSGYNKFGLLKNLNRLTGSLKLKISVSNGSSLEFVEDVRKAELKKKTHLHTINFIFINERNDQGQSSSPSFWVDLIEALEPNQNLQILRIWNYMGLRLPHWISSPLNLVREISLANCSKLLSLPPMGKLAFLEKLYIVGLEELKVVGVEWLGIRGREGEVGMDIPSSSSSVVAFPKLKILEIGECPEWWEWEDITAEEEESATVLVMPCLTELRIYHCKGLKMLPHRLLRKVSSFLLCIKGSSQLMEYYGNKDGSPWRSISQNITQLCQMDRLCHTCAEIQKMEVRTDPNDEWL